MQKKEPQKELSWWEKYRELIFFKVLFLLSSLRFIIFGFNYFPQLQDYRNYYNGFLNKLATARSLYDILNYSVWSRFWNTLIIPALIMSALLTASAWFLYKVCNRRFGSGTILAAIIVLSSATLEGTYWLTTSTRIVPGLFFASLAIYFFDKFTYSDKKINIILSGITGLVCISFYEPAFVFAAVFIIILSVIDRKKFIWSSLFLVVNKLIYLLLIKSNEGQIFVYPTTGKYFTYYLPIAFRQIRNALIIAPFRILTTGFWRGIQIAYESGVYWYLISSLLLIAAAVFLSKGERKKSNRGILIGILLLIAPLASFLFLQNTWISLSTTVICLPGAALMFDSLLSRFRKGYLVVLAAIITVFMVSSISEIHDYKLNYQTDRRIVIGIASALRGIRLDLAKSIVVLGLEPSHLGTQNYLYHEHIQGVTNNGTTLRDAFIVTTKSNLRQTLTPLPMGVSVNPESVMNADLYLDYSEGNTVVLIAQKRDNEVILYDENRRIGTIYINSEGLSVFIRD